MDQRRKPTARRLRRAAFSLLLATFATWAGLTIVESRERAWAQEAEEQQAAQLPAYIAAPGMGALFASGLR